MSYSLNSLGLRGSIWGIIYGTTIGVTEGDTRSLDHRSHGFTLTAYDSIEAYVGMSEVLPRKWDLFSVVMFVGPTCRRLSSLNPKP